MKYLACIALAVLPLQPATAVGGVSTIALPRGVDTIVIPADSPVTFASRGKHSGVNFDGRFVLSGTYYYGDAEFNDGPEVMLELTFIPDPAMAARLPYFKERGRPHAIFLTNGEALAKAVIPGATLAALNKKGAPYATGKVSILVDKFTTQIECDAPEYTARFISVYKPAVLVALAKSPDTGC